jgi:heme exporter protein B
MMMWRLFCLELRVAFRRSADVANPLWFFLIVITLFPLGIGPEPQLLARIAPGILWVAALLASLMALERLFRDDLLDGSLEQLMLLPLPLSAVVLVKVAAHWMVTGLPLLLLSPLVALLLGMDQQGWEIMALTLLLGTPTLGFLGSPGVGLTVGLRRGGLLMSVLAGFPFSCGPSGPLYCFFTQAILRRKPQIRSMKFCFESSAAASVCSWESLMSPSPSARFVIADTATTFNPQ